MSIEEGYCSHCFQLAHHTLEEQNYLRRNVYKCSNCNRKVVQCRVCRNMATTGTAWDSEFCAEHDGTIANFNTLAEPLDDLANYPRLFKRNSINYLKTGKIVGATVVSAAVIGPAAFYAGPAIGGMVGTNFFGLTGASAVSKGLAVLGGGAIKAGGAGMAGGMAVITASGTALGGAVGGVISNSYFGDIEGFSITKVRDGVAPAIIVIDGFLTQEKQQPNDWLTSLQRTHPRNACYYVRWESKKLTQIGNAIGLQASRSTALATARTWAARASKKATAGLGPLGWAAFAASIASNPWSIAMLKAEMTGVLLADIISRTNSRYIICGHSLGARVAHYALMSLGTKPRKQVVSAHLLGGAVGNQRSDWQKAAKAVSGKIHNYHSRKDEVLRILYAPGTAFSSSPIGRCQIAGVSNIVNHDVSGIVSGHAAHKEHFARFMAEIPPQRGRQPDGGAGRTAKLAPERKATGAKSVPTKPAADQATPDKIASKKAGTTGGSKKTGLSKSSPKKASPKKVAPKKTTPKKAAAKKTTLNKAAPKKAAPKKAAPKKTIPNKTARKKATAKEVASKKMSRRR